MSRWRVLFAAFLASAAVLVAVPDLVEAGLGASAAPVFPTTVMVGQTGIPVAIELTNQNTDPDRMIQNRVCNNGDVAPCPAGDPGVTLIASCGGLGAFSSCTTPDPGVFAISPTGVGQASTTCAGMVFDFVSIDPTYGTYRVRPQVGSVTLPGAGSVCRINFTVDVVKTPSVDRNASLPGIQTVQIVDNTQVANNESASARGTSTGTTVLRATPAIATVASPAVVVGGTVTDTATVTGRVNPVAGATITFNLYNDATCTSAPVFTSTVAIGADGTATSAPYTTTTAGDLHWIASYSGDANNSPVTGTCGDTNENVRINRAQPAITTVASPTVGIGGTVTDTATVTGRVNPVPGATITFNLYSDATCTSAPVFTSTVAIGADGTATSAPYTTTTAGDLHWIASYSGDANNAPVSGTCGDTNENVRINRAQPAIATVASPTVGIGGTVTDTATVTGRVNPVPGATITFNLYSDATCTSAPVFTSTVAIGADGTATSAPYTTTTAGDLHWIASYSGDANNAPVSGTCGDTNENVRINRAQPAITTVASPSLGLGGSIYDTASVTGLFQPSSGATVTFRLYGAGDPTCTAEPIFTSTVALSSTGTSGTATSELFIPAASGTYRWIATFNGDAANGPVAGACGDVGETVTISGPPLSSPPLPATGTEVFDQLAIGGSMLGLGLLFVGTSRRRRRTA